MIPLRPAGTQRIGLPEDGQGFVRRECPSCRRQFKTRGGPADGAIIQRYLGRHLYFENPHEIVRDDATVHCLYCGVAAPSDEWCTPQQRAWLEKVATFLGKEIRFEQMAFAWRTLEFNPSPTFIAVPPSDRLPEMRTEDDDMRKASFFCCVEEAKVDTHWTRPLHCPRCGSAHGAAVPVQVRLPAEPAEA
jgi:hypothetical protein